MYMPRGLRSCEPTTPLLWFVARRCVLRTLQKIMRDRGSEALGKCVCTRVRAGDKSFRRCRRYRHHHCVRPARSQGWTITAVDVSWLRAFAAKVETVHSRRPGGDGIFLLQVTCVALEVGTRCPSFRFFLHAHTHTASYLLPRISTPLVHLPGPRTQCKRSRAARNDIVTCLRVRVCQ